MTDRIALVLGLMIAAAVAADYVFADLANVIFLTRKLTVLTEYIAFWR